MRSWRRRPGILKGCQGSAISITTHGCDTYSVVAFIVNVRLVEKSVKSTAGRVMVENVMIQSSTLGIVFAISRTRPPARANHGLDGSPSRATAIAEGEVAEVGEVELRRELILVEREDKLVD